MAETVDDFALLMQIATIRKMTANDFREAVGALVQRAESAETQYINLSDLHRRTLDETEKTLLPEWQTVSDELASDGNSSWCSVMRGAVAMIRERAESAERERPKWISVQTEGVPPNKEYVLTACEGSILLTHTRWLGHRWEGAFRVTHWMPLPAAPSGETGGGKA